MPVRLINTIFFLALISLPFSVLAKDFGLGIVLGDPTGLTAEYLLNKTRSLTFDIGWNDGRVNLHGNHEWHNYGLFKIDKQSFHGILGVGGRLKEKNKKNDDDELYLGPRLSAAIGYDTPKVPIEITLGLAIILDLIPDTDTDINLFLTGRYFF